MGTKTLAEMLLTGHIISVGIIASVLYKQLRILHGKPEPVLHAGRIVLLVSAAVILLGNFIPIIVDSAVILGQVARSRPSGFGIAYALSNVLTLMFSAGALLALYVTADRLLKKNK